MLRTVETPHRIIPWILIGVLLSACASTEKVPHPGTQRLTPAQLNVQSSQELLAAGNPELALRKVLQALKLNPRLPSAYRVAAQIYDQTQQPELAEKYYERAIELAPDSAKTRVEYGTFLCRHERHRDGEEQFLIVTQNSDPHIKAVAYTNAGLCALRVPDPEGAAQYFRAALEAEPQMPVPYYQLAQINYAKGRYPQAQRHLQSYMSYGRPTPKVLLLGVRIAQALGDRSSFAWYARQLEDEFPDSEEARLLAMISIEPPDRGSRTAAPGTAGGRLEDLPAEEWILARDPGHYTIQLIRSLNRQALDYVRRHLPAQRPLAIYHVRSGERQWHALIYGDFPDRPSAEAAFSTLPARIRQAGAVIRPLASIQRAILDTP